MTYRDKHHTKWTAADHRAYLRDEAARALDHAQFHGYRTVAEYHAAQNWLAAQEAAAQA